MSMDNTIKSFRVAKGMTMQNLAEKTGTTASQINKLEKGERRLTADWMRRLAVALECSPLDLLKIDDEDKARHHAKTPQSGPKLGHLQPVFHIHPAKPSEVVRDGAKEQDRLDEHTWFIPKSVFSNTIRPDSKPAIVEVTQRDLEPDVRFGDYVLIDELDVIPSPAGIFVVQEGEQLVLRHCIMQSKMPGRRVKVTAMHQGAGGGAPVKTSTIVMLKDLNVKGRVLGHWHWI